MRIEKKKGIEEGQAKQETVHQFNHQIIQILILPNTPQIEMKTKGGLAAIIPFSFSGFLSSSCSTFLTLIVPLTYGCIKFSKPMNRGQNSK